MAERGRPGAVFLVARGAAVLGEGGPAVAAGSRALADAGGELAYVELADDSGSYERGPGGAWSGLRETAWARLSGPAAAALGAQLRARGAPEAAAERALWSRRAAARLVTAELRGPVRLALAGGGQALLGEGDHEVTDGASGQVAAYRQLGDGAGGRLAEPAVYLRGPGGTWARAAVSGARFQAWLAAGNQGADAARALLHAAGRPELAGAGTAELAALIRGGSEQEKFAAAFYYLAAADKEPWWTQAEAALAVTRGDVADQAPGEGKSLTGLLAAIMAAVRPGAAAVVVVPSTSQASLAGREHRAYARVLGPLGFAVHRVDPAVPAPAPVPGQPAVYVATTSDLAFHRLRHGQAPGRGRLIALHDEVDQMAVYDGTAAGHSYVLSRGQARKAPRKVSQAVEKARDDLAGLLDQGERTGGAQGLVPAHFGPAREARAPARP
jgi:hypothetical protein